MSVVKYLIYNSFQSDCKGASSFEPHLMSELSKEMEPEGLRLSSVVEDPFHLISTLRFLAARKTFKGTCFVCEDW
jgi:hypothetical protein